MKSVKLFSNTFVSSCKNIYHTSIKYDCPGECIPEKDCDDNLSVRVNSEWSGHVRSPWFCSPYQPSLNSCVQTIYSVSISSAPGAPGRPSYNIITPNGSHGPRLNLQWSRPQQENGIFRKYTLFYSHSEDPQRVTRKRLEQTRSVIQSAFWVV